MHLENTDDLPSAAPPLLDEKGFASAARWYVKGFSQRSGIQVNVNCTSEQERMPVRVEIALFRILTGGLEQRLPSCSHLSSGRLPGAEERSGIAGGSGPRPRYTC